MTILQKSAGLRPFVIQWWDIKLLKIVKNNLQIKLSMVLQIDQEQLNWLTQKSRNKRLMNILNLGRESV